MAQPKQRGPSRPPDAPTKPASSSDRCDPLPVKEPKDESKQPACPEGYPDRQPTKPPADEPDQRSH